MLHQFVELDAIIPGIATSDCWGVVRMPFFPDNAR